jgi:hypothetical protein
VDGFLLAYDPGLLRRTDGSFQTAFFVDLGYGDEPVTTVQSAKRFRRINPRLPVLGVEIDPDRVAHAQTYTDEHTSFRLGGFDLPVRALPDGTTETVRLIRAFNVLRQYEEPAVSSAYDRLSQYLLRGGLLIEGTSDPFGSIWVANLVRKPVHTRSAWEKEALVFSTNFRTGFEPGQFQAVLPKNLIHRVVPGEPIFDFLQAWKQAALETSPVRVWGSRQWFAASARKLGDQGYSVSLRRKWLRRGVLIWKPNGSE